MTFLSSRAMRCILPAILLLVGCGGGTSRVETMRARATTEASNATILELQRASAAGTPISPNDTMAKLDHACQVENHRLACLLWAVNQTQREGGRERLAAAMDVILANSLPNEDVFEVAYQVRECARGPAAEVTTWEHCYDARALITTHFRWGMASGYDFSKVFPPEPAPAVIHHDEFEALFPAGHGYHCFRQSVSSQGRMTSGDICYRSAEVCERVRAALLTSPAEPGVVRGAGQCERFEGRVWAWAPGDESGYLRNETQCRARAQAEGGRVCLRMGDLER